MDRNTERPAAMLTKADGDYLVLDRAPAQDKIKKLVREAIKLLLKKDLDLIAIGGHEQAICHRLAVHLEWLIDGFNVDCEYNRLMAAPKFIGKDDLIKPDILIHVRLDDSANMFALEAKAHANEDSEDDITKLSALVTQQGAFQYRLGAFMQVNNDPYDLKEDGAATVDITWFDKVALDTETFVGPLNDDLLKQVQSRIDRLNKIAAERNKKRRELRKVRQATAKKWPV